MTPPPRVLRVTRVSTIRLQRLDAALANSGEEIALHAGHTALLGRARDARVAFHEAHERQVSRRHALLWLARETPAEWHLIDLASTGGTRVNGVEIQAVRLATGDVVELGWHGPRLRVELVDD